MKWADKIKTISNGDIQEKISKEEIQEKVTEKTVHFAEEFGKHLANRDNYDVPLTPSKLRKFFGEVKRQQLSGGYDETKFYMLKPKLAYEVGRARQKNKKIFYKIEDFYSIVSDAIDKVAQSNNPQKAFRNFVQIFEAIVAYHKQYAEE